MTDLYKWRIYCKTDSRFEYIWDTIKPTTCPVDNTHNVNLCSVADIVAVNRYRTVTNKNSPYKISGYNVYRCDTVNDDVVVKLSAASGANKGRVIIIQKLSGYNLLTIYPYGDDKIDGEIKKSITRDRDIIKIESDGNDWKSLDTNSLTGELNEELEGVLYNGPFNEDNLVIHKDGDFRGLKLNLTAETDPTPNDDTSLCYSVGSRWINLVRDVEYVCVDSTAGQAVWKESTCCEFNINVDNTSISNTGDVLHIINPPTSKGDIFTHNGTEQGVLSVGTDNHILTADSSEPYGLKWVNISSLDCLQCWVFTDTKSSSTNGGTATSGAWFRRDVNTVEQTCGPEVVLLDCECMSRIKFVPGKYSIFVTSSFCKTKGTRMRLYNVTDSVSLAASVNVWADAHSNCVLYTCVKFTKETIVELQYRCCQTQLHNGLGSALGFDSEPEKYTVIKILK